MSVEVTYLELSQESGSSHKFYELTVEGTTVSTRYGRIGTQGRTQYKTYPTAEKAQQQAQKKIKEKLREGYEKAIKGVRKKRTITRREVKSSSSSSPIKAPLLWQFKSDSPAFGIFIDQDHCWMGNQKGTVYKFNHQGEIINQFQLPDGVKCLVGDYLWLYAGCDDGNVYDLSGKIPRVAYSIDENIDIYWLDIYDGILAVSDANGAVVKIDPEEEIEWTRLSQGSAGWMIRIDEQGIYHGHTGGMTMYNLEEGLQIWHLPTPEILFGWQETTNIYGGTIRKTVEKITKQGVKKSSYQCDAPVYSCATTPQGKYVFAGDSSSSLYCFTEDGTRIWKLRTGCGSALSMQFFQDRLYLVTTDGSFACMDATETAIKAAQAGKLPQTKQIQIPQNLPIMTTSPQLETISSPHEGIILKCIEEGNKLRVRVMSEGFNQDWNVQFPRHFREKGVQYLVDGVQESNRGGFYRVCGEIKRLR